MTLANNNSNLLGGVIVNNISATAGVIVGNNNALGAPTAPFVLNGGFVEDDGNAAYTIPNPLEIDAGTTATRTLIATNTADNLTFTGVITGPGSLSKSGPGTVVFTSPDTRTSSLTINQGTLDLSGNGSEVASSGITVNPGATLTLDNTITNNANRIGGAVPITLAGGTFNFLGNNAANTATTQTLAAVTINAGDSAINSQIGTATGDTSSLNIASVTRTAGGLLAFTGVGAPLTPFSTAGSNFITITGTGTGLQNSILNTEPETFTAAGLISVPPIEGPVPVTGGNFLPWATVAYSTSLAATPTTLDFASTSGPGSAGPYSISAFAAYQVETLSAAGPKDVVKITGSDSTLSSIGTAAALLISAYNASISGVTNGVMQLTDGAVLVAGSGNTFSPNLSYSGTEGILITGAGASLNISGGITNSTGSFATHPLTIGGQGSLTLSGANTYTSVGTFTNIDGGTLVLANKAALGTNVISSNGSNSNLVAAYGGTIQSGVAAGIAVGNPIAINTGTGALVYNGSTASLTFSGVNPLSLTGVISGAGGLTVSPSQTLTFGTNNSSATLSGGTFTLTYGGATTSPITYTTAGTNLSVLTANIQAALSALSSIGLNNSLVSFGGAATTGSGGQTGPTFSITLLNDLTGNVVSVAANNLTTSGGGSATLTASSMSAAGVLTLAGGTSPSTFANTYTGTTTVNAGTLKIGMTGAFAAFGGPVIINANGTMQQTGNFNGLLGPWDMRPPPQTLGRPLRSTEGHWTSAPWWLPAR